MPEDIFADRDEAYMRDLEHAQTTQAFTEVKAEVVQGWEALVGDRIRSLQVAAFQAAVQSKLVVVPREHLDSTVPCGAFEPATYTTIGGQPEVLTRHISLAAEDSKEFRELVKKCQITQGVQGAIHAFRRNRTATMQAVQELDPQTTVEYVLPSNPTKPLESALPSSAESLLSTTLPTVGEARKEFEAKLAIHAEAEQQFDWLMQHMSTKSAALVSEIYSNDAYDILREYPRWSDYGPLTWLWVAAEINKEFSDKDVPKEVKKIKNAIIRANQEFVTYVDVDRYKATAEQLAIDETTALHDFERLLLYGPDQDDLHRAVEAS